MVLVLGHWVQGFLSLEAFSSWWETLPPSHTEALKVCPLEHLLRDELSLERVPVSTMLIPPGYPAPLAISQLGAGLGEFGVAN